MLDEKDMDKLCVFMKRIKKQETTTSSVFLGMTISYFVHEPENVVPPTTLVDYVHCARTLNHTLPLLELLNHFCILSIPYLCSMSRYNIQCIPGVPYSNFAYTII